MKKTIYLSVLLSLGLLGSCQKADEPQSLSTTEVQASEGTFELRLTAGVSEDAMRALTFDGVGDLSETPKISQSSDFTTHAFFRKKGSNQVGYAKINWLVEGTSGNLKLKLPQTNITLQNMDDQTIDEGEEWYVAGIAGGGVLNSTKDGVRFEPDLNSDPQTLRAPIAFPWTRIYKNKMINVTFNPKGVLLRAVVANHVGKRLASIDFDITSNELDYMGQFDFSVASNPLSRIEDNAEALWKFNTGSFGVPQTAKLKFRVKDFEPEAKKHVMVWGMSRQISGGQNLTVVPSTAKTVEVLRAGRVYPFVTKTPMRNTQAYTIEVDLDVLNPIQYLAPANLRQDGRTFATDDELNNSGFFTFSETREFRDNPLKKVPGYTPPNSFQVAALAGYYARDPEASGTLYRPSISFNYAWSLSRDDENIQIGSVVRNVTSHYRSLGNGIVYALRMKKSERPILPPSSENTDPASQLPEVTAQTDDTRTMIFRYERKSNGRIKITCARIGDDPTITLDRISNEAWWNETNNTWFRDNNIRLFSWELTPTGRRKAGSSEIEHKHSMVTWWTTSYHKTSSFMNPICLEGYSVGLANAATANTAGLGRPVRLIKDMDI
ncbi:MAG: hypothetical protein Q4A61_06735 [Porphyromonadaceae bacterium]|nr:hypothetical protein [Porphyromonadaceae bacterium]